jgi:hypothetical protein
MNTSSVPDRRSRVLDAGEKMLGRTRSRRASDEKCRSLPKAEPLRGSLHAELKRCGKQSCHCVHGTLHGPYWSLRWREHGRQYRRYVRPDDLERVRVGLDQWRQQHPPARAMRECLRELRQLLRGRDGGW